MSIYLNQIDYGLVIEKPKLILPWNLQKKEIFEIIHNINVINSNDFVFKATLSEMPFINCIGLHFANDRLSKIVLSSDEINSNEVNLYDIYGEHQLVLENLFGKPRKNCFFEKMFTQVNKGDMEYKWKFRNITLKHKIWDRFGLEENIEIYIHI